MHYKTIVTVIRGEEDGNRVMSAITPFVTANNAHVIAVHAETSALAYMPVAGIGAAAYDEAIIEANKERMAELESWYTSHCKKEGISHEFRGFENFMGDSAISAVSSAFACDLIVTQQSDPSTPGDAANDLETLLFETGRPVLLIPYTCTDALEFKKVVIDGEDDAEKSGMMNAAEIAAALDRHGIKVEIRNEISGSIPVSAAIENRLSDFGADLLIMGAYSRPRIAERIFGGVTNTIMQTMITPTFLSH